MPAAPQPPGQTSVWQANPQWPQPSNPQRRRGTENRQDGSAAGLEDWETLERMIPPSEREGTNEHGIPRKLLWLAENGYPNMYPREETVAAQDPQPARKDRRQIQEELRAEQMKFQEVLKQVSKNNPKSRKTAKDLGPAFVKAPRGKWANAPPPNQPPAQSERPNEPTMRMNAEVAARNHELNTTLDASTWLDSYQQQQYQQQYNPAFAPEAAHPPTPEAYGTTGSGSTSTSEEQYAYAYTQPGQQPYYDPSGYSTTQPQFSPYPGMNGYYPYVGDIVVSPGQRSDRSYW
ncbi:hypothetical protein FRC07_000834 [Ceratobasidium sp. 392]|nr:hypothetical protein FRC07_000834 [Ceratobasidium sp. 392]